MRKLTIDNDTEVVVQFIADESVICVIKDETAQVKNIGSSSKCLTETPNRQKNASHCNLRASIKNKKAKPVLDNFSTDEEYSDNESDIVLKPKALFEDGDIPGERMFNFRSKVKTSTNQLSTPKTPKIGKKSLNSVVNSQHDSESLTDCKFGYKTPKKSRTTSTKNNVECVSDNSSTLKSIRSKICINTDQMLKKTPKVIRKKIAKGIANQKFEQLNELNDSEYSNSDKSDESNSESSVSLADEIIKPEVKNTNVSLRRSTRKKEISFVYKSEEYFLSKSVKSVKKSKTSDNTLKLLKNPTLDKRQVDKLSENCNTVHEKKLKAMYKETISNFPYWLCVLKEGFNLLLYGFGSKRRILNEFRKSMLEKELVLVINGFFPGLTQKEILESITIDLLDLESCPGSAELAIHQIEEIQKSKNAEHIYILIHNLDGVELQNHKIQYVLSRICSLQNIHLIASIDRVNAALLWDNTKLGDYNFIWMDCTNYSPYTIETSFMESLMVKNTGSIHAFSALNNVYKSLTSNTKRILLLLIKDRIKNKHDKKYGGVPFSILYGWCRQQFLVSTDLALRSQLTEFVDHELVKWKRDADVLYVTVDVDVLIQFYKQNDEDNE